MTEDGLIESLRRAVSAAPDDSTLRLHLADLLVTAGRGGEAIEHAAAVLQQDPTSTRARELMASALAPSTPADGEPVRSADSTAGERPEPDGFDWQRAETDVGDSIPPMFVTSSSEASEIPAYDVEHAGITLDDVGGMSEVKKRLHAAFLAPMRNGHLRTAYRKSLRGGLLLYGPPGCGKTYIARALAGELGAGFISVTISDILDRYIGQSESNLHEIFEVARANGPCVLFLDEIDAIGMKRSRATQDWMRTTINQLLTELSGVEDNNEGVFVLAATNQPWDVDPALRRPGRLDRALLVLPPDLEAREAIWQMHLRDRPIAGIDTRRLAKATDGYTGADIAHACESAAEVALLESAESGRVRMIEHADIDAALRDVRPSVGPWFETARNVALFANDDGTYDELATYLRRRRKL